MFLSFFFYYQYDRSSKSYSASLNFQIIFVLDTLALIVLQTAMILVPFHWMSQLITLFVESSFFSNS